MTDQDKDYPKTVSGKPIAQEKRADGNDGRRFSPSTARNRDVIRDTFLSILPTARNVLEIASGTGEHGAHLTTASSELRWTYTDIDAASLASQRAWMAHEAHDRLRGPFRLDTTAPHWGEAEDAAPYDTIFCANMVHISPLTAAFGLLRGAGRVLGPEGRLCLYGPFARNGEIAPSNARFSVDLKRRDPEWGVRDLDLELIPIAEDNGLELESVIDMPANNLFVIFARP